MTWRDAPALAVRTVGAYCEAIAGTSASAVGGGTPHCLRRASTSLLALSTLLRICGAHRSRMWLVRSSDSRLDSLSESRYGCKSGASSCASTPRSIWNCERAVLPDAVGAKKRCSKSACAC